MLSFVIQVVKIQYRICGVKPAAEISDTGTDGHVPGHINWTS